MSELRIEYDDNALDIMDKINCVLEYWGLEFQCDNLEHDGFEIYSIMEWKK